MKLYATVTSERGKPATKGGQEYLQIKLQDEDRDEIALLTITIDEDGYNVAYDLNEDCTTFHRVKNQTEIETEAQA